MARIYEAGEERPLTHTDSYLIEFKYQEDGFEKRGSTRLWACGKNKHEQVEAYFRKRNPGKKPWRITYE